MVTLKYLKKKKSAFDWVTMMVDIRVEPKCHSTLATSTLFILVLEMLKV
jgi:hypothetical protein